jgi:hypothetical protein
MPTEAERLVAIRLLLKAVTADMVRATAEPDNVDLDRVLGWVDQALALAEGRAEK